MPDVKQQGYFLKPTQQFQYLKQCFFYSIFSALSDGTCCRLHFDGEIGQIGQIVSASHTYLHESWLFKSWSRRCVGSTLPHWCACRCPCTMFAIKLYTLSWGFLVVNDSENVFNGSLTRYVNMRIAHAPGMPGTFSPPWCISGPLNCSGGENVPGIPGACATRNFKYLARAPWSDIFMKSRKLSWHFEYLVSIAALQTIAVSFFSLFIWYI